MSKLDLLRPYINKDEPFGPIDAYQIGSTDIVGPTDIEALRLLFEKQNRVYKSFRDRPSIIMGRRGSGKTSYLRSVYFGDQYDYYVNITTENILEHISTVIHDLSSDTVYTEAIWKLWEKTLWTCVLTELSNKSIPVSGGLIAIDKYLELLNIKNGDSVDTVLWKLAGLNREVIEANSKNGLSEVLRQFDEKDFGGAKLAAIESLRSTNKKLVILMDSLEDFKLNIVSVERAIEGLLKCAGSMNNPNDVVDIRLCLPTELAGMVIEISSNPIKDFHRELKLEWTAKELILIGAQRLMYFIGLYHPDLIKRKSPFDELKRSEALALFKVVLPEKITNRRGFQEHSISYILRHTQLLPRHFLILLNSIFKGMNITQNPNPYPIRADNIINGIREVEERIVKEIFSAFRMIHPTAEDVCRRCLPELEHVFSQGKLRQIFNRHGKVVFNGGEFNDFQQMLIEIGAIGRVVPGAESDLYINGKFRYTMGHELTISHLDDICIHPLFSGIYSSDGKKELPVYPDGSGVDDQDYRNFDG